MCIVEFFQGALGKAWKLGVLIHVTVADADGISAVLDILSAPDFLQAMAALCRAMHPDVKVGHTSSLEMATLVYCVGPARLDWVGRYAIKPTGRREWVEWAIAF